jgi:uncharacterized small protein (DUF1192 family)
MQDAAIEVESNILVADRLRIMADADRRKGKSEASTSGPSLPHPQVNELTQVMNFLKEEMERLKVERKKMNKGPQSAEIKGGFRMPNNFAPPTMHREKERDKDNQRIQAPFQNNFVADEEGEADEHEPKIHCL